MISKRRRRFALVTLLAGSAFALAACLEVDANVTVNADATASGDMTITVDESLASVAGITSGEMLLEQMQSDETASEEFQSLDCSPVEDAVAINCTFENQAFVTDETLWTIESNDDGTVSFAFGPGEEAQNDDDDMLDAMTPGVTYTFSVEMPGAITSIEGDGVEQTSDTTFEFETDTNGPYGVVVTSEVGSDSGIPIVPIVMVLGFIGAGAAFYVLSGKNRGGTTDGGPGDRTGDQPRDDQNSTWIP